MAGVSFHGVTDPETGQRMRVGTFRDVTAEHYAVQRDAAVAAVRALAEDVAIDTAAEGTAVSLRIRIDP